jgi:hypothetical protein
MLKPKILINTLIVLLIILALYFGYTFIFGDTEEETTPLNPTLGSLAGVTAIEEDTASDFVKLLDHVKTIDLSATIFQNQIFSDTLKDYTTPLPDRNKGRNNPFAPVSAGE